MLNFQTERSITSAIVCCCRFFPSACASEQEKKKSIIISIGRHKGTVGTEWQKSKKCQPSLASNFSVHHASRMLDLLPASSCRYLRQSVGADSIPDDTFNQTVHFAHHNNITTRCAPNQENLPARTHTENQSDFEKSTTELNPVKLFKKDSVTWRYGSRRKE